MSEKARILVVEDEAIVAMSLQARLENLRYAVVGVVASGEEAIERAADLSPDLILMDIRLSGTMDGIEAAEQIRVRFDIPVVYLTAHADQAMLQRAKLTGPFGYLIKPVDERALHTAIEVALYKHEMERKLKESEELYRVVVENLYDSISIRSGGRFVFVNKAFLDLHGLKGVSEVIGLPRDQFILPEDRELVKARDLSVNRGGPNEYDYKIRRTDGELRIVQTASVTITYRGRLSSLEIVRDVTERRQVVEALLSPRRREILRLIADGMPTAISRRISRRRGDRIASTTCLRSVTSRTISREDRRPR